jgi:hypothetical protein
VEQMKAQEVQFTFADIFPFLIVMLWTLSDDPLPSP